VADTENKGMRKTFNIRTYHGGSQWDAQQARKETGAIGGRRNAHRAWVKKEKASNGE
jgi:hypothetical protein